MAETMTCKRCGNQTSMNRWELCTPCRVRKCQDCRKNFRSEIDRMTRCWKCHHAKAKREKAVGPE